MQLPEHIGINDNLSVKHEIPPYILIREAPDVTKTQASLSVSLSPPNSVRVRMHKYTPYIETERRDGGGLTSYS